MHDYREEAIDTAWNKSEWPRNTSSGTCTKHAHWNVNKSKMKNGEKFGPKRGQAWYRHVFATCDQSFRDGIAMTAARWREDGDEAGADHIMKLANTSNAPLHRWAPVACPFIASGGSESVNQLVKKSPKDGKRRQKLTFMQQCRTIVDVAYRSWQVLKQGPLDDAACIQKRLRDHMNMKTKPCPGRYAVVLAGMFAQGEHMKGSFRPTCSLCAFVSEFGARGLLGPCLNLCVCVQACNNYPGRPLNYLKRWSPKATNIVLFSGSSKSGQTMRKSQGPTQNTNIASGSKTVCVHVPCVCEYACVENIDCVQTHGRAQSFKTANPVGSTKCEASSAHTCVRMQSKRSAMAAQSTFK